MRKILCLALMASLVFIDMPENGKYVLAKEVNSNSETSVIGSVTPTLIQVSAPAVIMFSIDPNKAAGNRFTSSDIRILNKSNASVKVKISAGKDNFSLASGSSWKPVNMLPDTLQWDDLGTSESESYIALGIKPGEGTWKKILRPDPLYVAEQKSNSTDTVFGEIQRNSDAYMQMVCYHGSSFNEGKECLYRIIWSFSLGD